MKNYKGKPIPPEVLANYRYDETSPSCLVWARDHVRGKAGDCVGTLLPTGYFVLRSGGEVYLVHRIICTMFNGPIPEGGTVDHKEGKHNLKDNLRIADRCQQNHNIGVRRTSTTGIKGVTPFQNGYRGQVRCRGVVYRKLFPTIEQATEYVQELRERLHGGYARSARHV